MTVSRDQFLKFLEKRAQDATELESNDQEKGSQDSAVPALLQPEEGPGVGERGAEESMTSSSEKIHKENREGGYLQDALPIFSESAKETGKQLGSLLSNFGPDTVSSKPQTVVGKTKAAAFLDELSKISRQG